MDNQNLVSVQKDNSKDIDVVKPSNSFAELYPNYFQYQFLKSYLYNAAHRTVESPLFKVVSISARNTQPPHQATQLSIQEIHTSGCSLIQSPVVQASDQYVEFVKSKTTNEYIMAVLECETILSMLEAWKISGAFIATLVQQLEVMDKLGRFKRTPEFVANIIHRLDRGFDKEPEKVNGKTGFEIY